jgi:hypothetical protein
VVTVRRIARVALALVLILSSVSAGVAPASAVPDGGRIVDCGDSGSSYLSATLSPIDTLLNSIWDSRGECRYTSAYDREIVEGNKTEQTIYDAANTDAAQESVYLTDKENFVNQSRQIAYCKGETAAIDALQAGKSESEALEAATNASQSYLSKQEQNVLRQWNVSLWGAYNLAQTARGQSNSRDVLVAVNISGVPGQQEITDYNPTGGTYYLVNGSSVSTLQLVHAHGSYAVVENPIDDQRITVLPPENTSLDQITYVDSAEYIDLLVKINDTSLAVESDLQTFTSGVYADVNSQNSSVDDISEYQSPCAVGQQFAADYNATGAPIYGVASLAASGVAVPDLGETGTMTIRTGPNTTYTGWLASQSNPPGGQWESGRIYDGATMDGLQWIVTTNGTQKDLEQDFTVESIRDRDGNAVSSVNVTKPQYAVSNVSEYNKRQKLVRVVINDTESRSPQGPGDGQDPSGGSWKVVLGVFALGILVALAFAARG